MPIVVDTTLGLQGFPYGTKPGEEERVSLPNASYTKGNYMVSETILVTLIRRPLDARQLYDISYLLDYAADPVMRHIHTSLNQRRHLLQIGLCYTVNGW